MILEKKKCRKKSYSRIVSEGKRIVGRRQAWERNEQRKVRGKKITLMI